MAKIALLASGNGTNAEAIIKHFDKRRDVQITCFCDVLGAPVFDRLKNLGKEVIHLPLEETYDYFSKNSFDLYVLAGYMSILPENVLSLGTFVNIHPSLLPSFKGKDAIKQAYDYGAKITGVSIHYVTKDVDGGPIIAQTPVKIEEGMNLSELEEEIHNTEHLLYPMIVESLIYDKLVDFLPKKSGHCSSGNCGGCNGKCGS